MAAPVIESSASDQASNVTSRTDSVTVGTGLSNSALIVCVGVEDTTPGTVTGVTYNGVAMTLLYHRQGGANWSMDMYFLASPATGANTVVASFSESVTSVNMHSIVLSGAHQTLNDGTQSTGSFGAAQGNVSIPITGKTTDAILLGFAHENTRNANFSSATGTTVIIDQNGTYADMISGYVAGSVGADTVDFTTGSGTTWNHALAVEILGSDYVPAAGYTHKIHGQTPVNVDGVTPIKIDGT